MSRVIRVLLADDHASMRDGMRLVLEIGGTISVVGAAADGSEAIREAARLVPDVVVMDIAMPEVNGIDAIEAIRTRNPETRVVILSMHLDAAYVRRALRAGASGYLLKESAGSEVAEAVRAVHGGQRYLSSAVASVLAADVAAPGAESKLDALSMRERHVLQQLAEGRTSAEIAQRLSLSPKTVETYRSRLMRKLEMDDIASLVKFAIRHGLTTLD